MKRDLTSGSVSRNLLAMSIPAMIGMLGQTLYDVVDIIWVGQISPKAVAGVTLFSAIFWIVEVLNEIIGVSSIALITQSYGAGDRDRAARVIEQTIVFKVFVAVIAAAIAFFGLEPAIRFFSNDAEVVKAALDYGYIRLFFLPVFFATFSCFTALRCTGDPASQMWIMIGVSLLNAVLAPLFMFSTVPFVGLPGLGLGVFGAGVAAVICITAAFVVAFSLLSSGRTNIHLSPKGLFRLDWAIDRKLVTIGLASGGENLARQLAGLVTTKFVALYGTTAIAVLGVGNRLGGLVFMPLFGLMSGGGTIVGQNLGANNLPRAAATARTASLFGGLTITTLIALAWIFPEAVLGLFLNQPEAIALGVPMLRIMGPSFALVSFALALACAFSGSGHNLPLLISSLVSRWGVQFPFLLLVVFALPALGLDAGLPGVWASFLAAEAVEAAIIFRYYRQGAWKDVRV